MTYFKSVICVYKNKKPKKRLGRISLTKLHMRLCVIMICLFQYTDFFVYPRDFIESLMYGIKSIPQLIWCQSVCIEKTKSHKRGIGRISLIIANGRGIINI